MMNPMGPFLFKTERMDFAEESNINLSSLVFGIGGYDEEYESKEPWFDGWGFGWPIL